MVWLVDATPALIKRQAKNDEKRKEQPKRKGHTKKKDTKKTNNQYSNAKQMILIDWLNVQYEANDFDWLIDWLNIQHEANIISITKYREALPVDK